MNLLTAYCPAAMAELVKKNVKAYNNESSFAMIFPSAAAAADFLATFRAQPEAPAWTDFRDNTKHELKARPDRSIAVRAKNRVLGGLWKKMQPMLVQKGTFPQGSKMGTTGPKGGLCVTNAEKEEIWEIFTVKEPRLGGTEAPKHLVIPHKDNLSLFGVSEQEAQAAIDQVINELMEEDESRNN